MEKGDVSDLPAAHTIHEFGQLPRLPPIRIGSPQTVLVCDRIRRELDNRDGFEEFCWFAREYPRCYRFHMNGAEFRLRSVHGLMESLHSDLQRELTKSGRNTFEFGVFDARVNQVYWDFESFLSEISISLDLLSRVVGPAFKEQAPPSFNKLCKWLGPHPILDQFHKAQTRWVRRLKSYRDCFTHYTPVDTMLMVSLRQYPDKWELRAKLPTNPNAREILRFRYSRRVELLRYALSVYKHMQAFDRKVAALLWKLYSRDEFPLRKDRLFFVGRGGSV